MKVTAAQLRDLPVNTTLTTPGRTTWVKYGPDEWHRAGERRSSRWVANHVKVDSIDRGDRKMFAALGNLIAGFGS